MKKKISPKIPVLPASEPGAPLTQTFLELALKDLLASERDTGARFSRVVIIDSDGPHISEPASEPPCLAGAAEKPPCDAPPGPPAAVGVRRPRRRIRRPRRTAPVRPDTPKKR